MSCCPPKKPKCSVKKTSCRGGRKTRNAFFNFLRRFRKKHCGMTITQIAVLGARKWNCMSDQEKCKYVKEARCARPFRKRPKCCPKPKCSPKRKRRSCRKPMKCGPKPKKRCPSKRKKSRRSPCPCPCPCPCPPKKSTCPPKRPVCCPPPKRPVCCPPPPPVCNPE